jgi:DNA-binding NarL/FixJ family response regulator
MQIRILIADDEQIIRFGLKLVLKNLWPEVEIDEAESLDGVVALITSLTYDLVILDIHMPGSDGLENLIRFMLQESKVVIFSGYEPTSPRIQSLGEAGVDQFIFKSASLDEIRFSLKALFI